MTTTTTAPRTITVLGLGRMGSAMAARLSHDWDVTGWTRSGRTPSTFPTTDDPRSAVAKADVVVLALFDGAACREVLDTVAGSLRTETVVLNTSTVSPAEAAEFAARHARYVHAPVLGSIPAVTAGELKILAAGDATSLLLVRPVLEALGTVRECADAPTSAALKLLANSSLAGALLALRDALRQADGLGLTRAQALDVLELGHLGGLVTRKRPLLTGPPTGAADFTLGALAKDLALLADASGVPLPAAAALAATPAAPDADIAVVATTPAAPESVLRPLRAYLRGHATGEPAHFREAFLPSAHVEGIRDGAFVSWPLDAYCGLFSGRPAPDEAARTRRIDSVEVHGTVATATMTLQHGPDTFTDVFLLVRTGDGDTWHIANKAYHRHC
ncbi:dehydrogenase [Streptomyces spiroverticillatus]|uniref:Dehydrogenase n=1 Tax=Streptomyces finlayi TaxID=67296 RepID=A0A919CBY4_9ACTN|nr:nuclear transport factor 2 family protein [Streptomyces finlayi]GHA21868.1 dehydrogenase [Streptomyces spiroverticillatus]GHD04059.1 dehydrogenase [Streptomyces finlayi]